MLEPLSNFILRVPLNPFTQLNSGFGKELSKEFLECIYFSFRDFWNEFIGTNTPSLSIRIALE